MNKVNLVDLDGTFVSVNSFHVFYLILLLISSKNVGVLVGIFNIFRVSLMAVRRGFGLIEHAKFKREVQKAWAEMPAESRQEGLDRVIKILSKRVNQELFSALSERKKMGEKVILCTAAVEEYVIPFLNELEIFDAVVCTPNSDSDEWVHQIGLRKRKSVEALLRMMGISDYRKIVYTDHPDDTPLIEISDECYLYSPISKNIEILEKEFPEKIYVIKQL